jgi:general secretion pathway protein F
LDQLIALNDEMAALVRAGIPLERGLIEMGREMPGRLGEIATAMGHRIERGESLAEVLGEDQRGVSPVWRAVVQAGMRSGNLSAALEGMATTGRHVADLRRAVSAAWIYPLVVIALAYCCFVFLVTMLVPVIRGGYEDLTESSSTILVWLDWLGQTAFAWAVLVPAIAILAGGLWWYRSKYAIWTSDKEVLRRPGRFGMSWPSAKRSLRDGRLATFAELLALLNQQQVPLEESLVLAADASGDRGLGRSAREVADRIRRGEILDGRDLVQSQFPPLLGWLALSGMQQSGVNQTLSLSAEMYRQRAARAATWAAVYLPVVLTTVFGGTAVLLQSLAVFGPIIQLLYDLSRG